MNSFNCLNIIVPKYRALLSWRHISCTCCSVNRCSLKYCTEDGLNMSLEPQSEASFLSLALFLHFLPLFLFWLFWICTLIWRKLNNLHWFTMHPFLERCLRQADHFVVDNNVGQKLISIIILIQVFEHQNNDRTHEYKRESKRSISLLHCICLKWDVNSAFVGKNLSYDSVNKILDF